jgi:hypothetical protein
MSDDEAVAAVITQAPTYMAEGNTYLSATDVSTYLRGMAQAVLDSGVDATTVVALLVTEADALDCAVMENAWS